MEIFIHLPDAEQSPHTPEKNNCILTETKQPSLELGPRETLSQSVAGAMAGQQSQELVLASGQFSPLLDLPLDGTEGPGQVPGGHILSNLSQG